MLICGCAGIQQELTTAYPESDLWTGEWQSKHISRARGEIWTMIPKDISNGQTVSVPVAMSFSSICPYYAGKTFVASFKGTMQNNTVNAEYHPDQKIDPRILNFKFSDGRNRTGEEIVITFNEGFTSAEGFWVSQDSSIGVFTLHKSRR